MRYRRRSSCPSSCASSCCLCSSRLKTRICLASLLSNCRTISEPIEPVPPVTRTVLFLNSFMFFQYVTENARNMPHVPRLKPYIKREGYRGGARPLADGMIALAVPELLIKFKQMNRRQIRLRLHPRFGQIADDPVAVDARVLYPHNVYKPFMRRP